MWRGTPEGGRERALQLAMGRTPGLRSPAVTVAATQASRLHGGVTLASVGGLGGFTVGNTGTMPADPVRSHPE